MHILLEANCTSKEFKFTFKCQGNRYRSIDIEKMYSSACFEMTFLKIFFECGELTGPQIIFKRGFLFVFNRFKQYNYWSCDGFMLFSWVMGHNSSKKYPSYLNLFYDKNKCKEEKYNCLMSSDSF